MGNKIRAVVAGCGGISAAWLTPAKEMADLEIVGLVDLREEAARARAEQFQLKEAVISTDLRRVLKKVKPDVVFDCTLPEAHYSVTLTALKQRCHVLGEKPLADTMAHARAMVAAARRAGRIYAVIQNRRYEPNIRRVRRFLASGALGQITTVKSDFFIGAHFGGFRDRMKHVLLLDMAIHTLDAARYVTAADARTVYCHEFNPAGSWYDHDASAIAIFEMSGGIVYTYQGSWCAEGLNTKWECDWRIVGSKGTLLWDGGDGFKVQTVKPDGQPGFFVEKSDGAVPPAVPEDRVGGHAGLIREFLDCVQSGTVPETIATDNIKSLAMVHAAIASATRGRKLPVHA